ncbi:FecR family protein [Pedobacter nyackensis]|uniref:FecR family protein n=2 Tax=Pedobacter nyackensis TaxID=475255 RepID=A0A1W2DUV0_9SPHI|nr:FecR family protein [Pedobacter nyackensis]
MSSSELEEFQQVILNPDHQKILHQQIEEHWDGLADNSLLELPQAKMNKVFNAIVAHPQPVAKRGKFWASIAIAAAVVVAVFGVGLFYYDLNLKPQPTEHLANKNEITPGIQAATLTLANGKKIRLDDTANGLLAKEAGVMITKSANGQLIYEIKDADGDTSKINTLSTAKGETYQLRLPDGSLVWLNAASSLTYPVNLNERGKRSVKLDGEGYFEITKDKAHPFVVESKRQQIEVLGTHFNVSSYSDEPVVRTSLLEGSIQINGKTVLKPGEQSSVDPTGNIAVKEVNVNKSVAWKNGKFAFEDENIEGVMRKLARWYNVEIIYQGDFYQRTFTGTISRHDDISRILDKIAYTQAVRFKIDGRRIYVSRNEIITN